MKPEELAPKILDFIGRAITSRAKELCPKWHGDLMKSITYRVNVNDNTVVISVGVDYANDMEFGTNPGHLSEVEKGNIKIWAMEHGFNKGGQFMLVKKIEKEGIKVGSVKSPLHTLSGYRPFLRPAIHQVLQPTKLAEILRMVK